MPRPGSRTMAQEEEMLKIAANEETRQTRSVSRIEMNPPKITSKKC